MQQTPRSHQNLLLLLNVDMVLNVMAISKSISPSIQLCLFTHIVVSCSEAFYFMCVMLVV